MYLLVRETQRKKIRQDVIEGLSPLELIFSSLWSDSTFVGDLVAVSLLPFFLENAPPSISREVFGAAGEW